MENRAHALVAGLFVVFFSLTAAAALWWLGQDDVDDRHYLLESRRAVAGLNLQAPVRYRGIRAGKVVSIEPDPKDARLLLIEIVVDGKYGLTRGTTARLAHQGLTGLAYVLLDDVGDDPEPLAAPPGSLPRLAMTPGLMDRLTDQAGEIGGQAGKVMAGLIRLLDERNLVNLSRALENVAEASAGLKDVPRIVAGLREALSDANLKRWQAVLVHLEKTAGETTPLVADARESMRALTALSRRLDQLAADAGPGLTEAALPRANVLLQELMVSTRQLTRLLESLEETPQAVIFGRGEARPGPGEPGFALPRAK